MNSTTRRLSRNSTDWLLNSQLAPYVDAFTHHFNEGRYASRTVHGHLAYIAHFALWMSECRPDIHGVDEDVVQRFLDDHLPRCDCARPVQKARHHLRAALGHLLLVLRANSVIAERRSNYADIPPTQVHRYSGSARDAQRQLCII